MTSSAIAELKRPPRVACSDLLDHLSIITLWALIRIETAEQHPKQGDYKSDGSKHDKNRSNCKERDSQIILTSETSFEV